MSLQYSLIFNNLGIILWKLRYPIISSKNLPMQLLKNIRLLIISDILISMNDSFIEDVIRTIHLTVTEVYIITFDEINTVIFPVKCLDYCWCIGIKKLSHFSYVTFHTPSLSILKCDIEAKRNFWNQINQRF